MHVVFVNEDWFAWFPVRLSTGDWAWWRDIRRQGVVVNGICFDWKYSERE